MLTHPASDATFLVYKHAAILQFDRNRTDGTLVDADRAVLSFAADAGLIIHPGRAHVDLANWRRQQRAGWTNMHAFQTFANDARHRIGFDEWCAAAFRAGGIDFDALSGTDSDAVAAAAASVEKFLFIQRAGRTQPQIQSPRRR